MQRREAILRMTINCMLPGAMVGAIIGVLVAMATSRQADLPILIAGCAIGGVLIGAIVGDLIGDHREPT